MGAYSSRQGHPKAKLEAMRSCHMSWVLLLIHLVFILNGCVAVDRGNFKKCEQSSFCGRNRALKTGDVVYSVLPNTVQFDSYSVTADVRSSNSNSTLLLRLDVLQKLTARIRISEKDGLYHRYEVDCSLNEDPVKAQYKVLRTDTHGFKILYEGSILEVFYEPLRLDFFDKEGALLVTLNSKGLMNFESYRRKKTLDDVQVTPSLPVEDEDVGTDSYDIINEGKSLEEKEQEIINNAQTPDIKVKSEESVPEVKGAWEESFKEHHDSKPRGPSSVGMDISFIGFEHVYGIPEHADSLALKDTSNGEPYRLFNLDVFEYELGTPMALYGSIPFMWAHSARKTVGVFWNNAAETWVDIKSSKSVLSSIISFFHAENVPEMETHWFSESGIIDLFVMLGPKPRDVSDQYATLTGTTTLPPLFGMGYHQSRWNYDDQDDVAQVDNGFDEHDMPCDVIWLDIEHTDSKKYFTWDASKFPNSVAMIDSVAKKGRKMVTIIDPHIKRQDGYRIHDEARAKGLYVKNKNGAEYEGWCWSGSSSWIDFINPEARAWWASKFLLDQYPGSTLDLMTWNDMNEPSVFNGPEITMHKDALHYGNWEHRDVHNVYGIHQHMSTYQGHLQRSSGKERPFVLSRAFFAGTQRYGAIWTGDNAARWDHLKASIPMLLSINIAGLPFCGADVGGFFGNPDTELLVRWYQAGAFQPFFRAHAHLDTKRREPWLFGEENTKLMRSALQKRYRFLPLWYLLAYQASVSGLPIMRPMWFDYPEDKSVFSMDDQYMLGNLVLVKPVTEQGKRDVLVYFPGGKSQVWYDFDTYAPIYGGQFVAVDTPIDKIPVFIRGGGVIPLKNRVRRSSRLMYNDPYTLVVALNLEGEASGEIYIDDEHSLEYKNGKYIVSKFQYANGKLIKWDEHANLETKAWFERIIIIGLKSKPSKCTLMATDLMENLSFAFDVSRSVLEIKKPMPSVVGAFSIIVA